MEDNLNTESKSQNMQSVNQIASKSSPLKKIKKIILLIAILLVVICLGYLVFTLIIHILKLDSITPIIPADQLAECLGHPEINCWDSKGVCSFNYCSTSPSNKISYYYQVKAIQDNNPDLCYKVYGINGGDFFVNREEYINECLSRYAIEKNDLDTCINIQGDGIFFKGKSMCLLRLAGLLNRPDLCLEIKDSMIKDECISSFKSTDIQENLCFEMSAYKMRDCLKKLLDKNPSANYCSKVKDKQLSGDCYYFVAIQTKNKNLCANIIIWRDSAGYDIRYNCQIRIDARLGNKDVCPTIDYISMRDMCYKETAFYTGDSKLCSFVQSQIEKEICYENISKQNDPYKPIL